MAGLAAGMVALGTAVTGTVLFSFIGPGGLLAAGITALGVAASTASLSFNRDWRGVASEIKSGAVSVYEAYARVWSVEGRKAIFADIKVGIDGFIGNLKDLATWFGSAFPAAMKADCEIVKSVALYGFDVVKTAFTGFFNWLKEKVNGCSASFRVIGIRLAAMCRIFRGSMRHMGAAGRALPNVP